LRGRSRTALRTKGRIGSEYSFSSTGVGLVLVGRMIVVSAEPNASPMSAGASASQMLRARRTLDPIGTSEDTGAKRADRGGEKGHTTVRHGFIPPCGDHGGFARVRWLGARRQGGHRSDQLRPQRGDLLAAPGRHRGPRRGYTDAVGDPSSGNFHAVINGTVTDGAGNTWRFNYDQNGRPVGDGGDVQLTDHFNLGSNARVLHVHSHFVAVFSSTGDLVERKQLTGDPAGCDPI
jgi:hypothetical protein